MKYLSYTLFLILIFSMSPYLYAAYGAKICSKDDNLYCYKVKRGDTWAKLFDNPEERDLVMRINRINIRLYSGMTIAIPHHFENNSLLRWSPLNMQINPPGRKIIIVSLSKLAFGAYSAEGNLVHWGPISAAKGYCPDIRRGCHTPKGTFSIYSKQGRGCVSTKFPVGRGGAPMPYCMFFKGGFALHGSYNVPGYNDSHGCVRLFIDDAQWLNQNFTSGSRGVPVIVRET